MTVREKLKRLRNDLGLSQMDFSERVGLAYTTYRSIETGRQSCPRHVADKLAELFGLDAEAFFDVSNDTYLPPGGVPERLVRRSKKHKHSRPVPEPMVLPERCDTCLFRVKQSKKTVGCGYAATVGHTRGCKIGDDCIRYIRDIRRKTTINL